MQKQYHFGHRIRRRREIGNILRCAYSKERDAVAHLLFHYKELEIREVKKSIFGDRGVQKVIDVRRAKGLERLTMTGWKR